MTMDEFIDFFSFTNPNIRFVVLGTILLSASSAIVGSFILLKKKALIGDAISHSVLPGICAAFLFINEKNTVVLLVGAFLTGWLSVILIDFIVARSKIKRDTAIALVLSVFFGTGIVLLTYIQQSGNAEQSGLDRFLFGNAATLIGSDLLVFGSIAVLLVLVVYLFFKEFVLIAFDEQYATILGLPVRSLNILLTTLTVLAVVMGISAFGVVLMAAMLITPGAAARYWTNDFRKLLVLAAAFGAVSGITGAFISYATVNMPTGPWVVVMISLIAFFSFFFGPQKGIYYRWNLRRKNKRKIVSENVLKAFYHLGESQNSFKHAFSNDDLLSLRDMASQDLKWGLLYLKSKKHIVKKHHKWQLTANGLREAKRIVRLHRLWELYLTNKMNIAADHVHDDAETMEHIITPEMEKELEIILNFPDKDPHHSPIPK